jgi:predicted metal-binding protein
MRYGKPLSIIPLSITISQCEKGDIMNKYIDLALEMKMIHAKIITPADIVFDIRTLLKCTWGCENHDETSYKCQRHNTSYDERVRMVQAYSQVLLLHSSDGRDVSKAVLEIERQAFLDGYHLAFAVRSCNYCKTCAVDKDRPCIDPKKVRPCEAIFGIDVYRTAKKFDLPCYPLKTPDEVQNRYGFVFID